MAAFLLLNTSLLSKGVLIFLKSTKYKFIGVYTLRNIKKNTEIVP